MNISIILFQNGINSLKPDSMEKMFNISEIDFVDNFLLIKINDQGYKLELKTISEKLAKADISQRQNYVISSSGYGIHWPTLDEDLSISGLLNRKKIKHVA